MAYCNCYQITLKECLQEIVIAGNFVPFTNYHVFITDKFENVEHLEISANYSGNLIITVSDLPKGMFMSFSGSYSVQVFEEVVEGESCPVQPTGQAVVMEFCSGSYDCIEVSFEANEDDTVTQTIPDCNAEQPEIDEPFAAPQPYEDSFCPAVKKCIGIKSNGSDTKVLNEKGLFVEVPTGPEGPSGPAGADGADGLSAYEVAVANGFVGTEADWLLSLKGDTGATGPQGPAGSDAELPNPKARIIIFDDFVGYAGAIGNAGSSGVLNTSLHSIVKGANGTYSKVADTNNIGILRYTSSSNTTPNNYLYMNSFILGEGELSVEYHFNISALAGSKDYVMAIGLVDAITAAAITNGVYFLYNRSVYAHTIQCVCMAGGFADVQSSAIDITAATWHKYKIVVNAAGTEAKFYMNGVLVQTMTNNIPLATLLQGFFGQQITSSSYNVCGFEVDYISYDLTLTTPR